MKKTSLPIVAGILDIIAGIISLLAFIGLLIASIVTGGICHGWWPSIPWTPGIDIGFAVFGFSALISLIVGSLALTGGIFALQRKHWNLVLAGSVSAIFPAFIFGVTAVILTVISQKEFE